LKVRFNFNCVFESVIQKDDLTLHSRLDTCLEEGDEHFMEVAMSNCERTVLSGVTIARIAWSGVAGILAAGCTGDEPAQVNAAVQPSVLVAQTPLDGATVPKYVAPLTTLGDGARVDGTRAVNVDMVEF